MDLKLLKQVGASENFTLWVLLLTLILSCQATKCWFLLHGLDLCTAGNLNRTPPFSDTWQCLMTHFDLGKVNVTWKVKGQKRNWTFFLKILKELVWETEGNLLYRSCVASYQWKRPLWRVFVACGEVEGCVGTHQYAVPTGNRAQNHLLWCP